MIVDTTKERRCRILADVLHKEVTPTWVLIQERADIVDESRNKDQRASLSLLDNYPGVRAQ